MSVGVYCVGDGGAIGIADWLKMSNSDPNSEADSSSLSAGERGSNDVYTPAISSARS
jgi:hypothetical protein